MLETGHLLGCSGTSFRGTYMPWMSYRGSLVGQISGFGPVGAGCCKGGILVDGQEYVLKELSYRNMVGKSGCCFHFHLSLEAFPYSLPYATNFYFLSRHHS